jgi:hypothetical protein
MHKTNVPVMQARAGASCGPRLLNDQPFRCDAGMNYMVGSALKARVPDALVPQTWFAQNLERFFAEFP